MRGQHGFTMVEVMIAFLVMAIGLLGVIGLQNSAVRNNYVSTSRMQAVLLGREMADMMRANPAAINTKDYNQVAASNNSACSATTGCTPAQMAQYDKYVWDAHITDSLGPNAKGVVCIDSTGDDTAISAGSPGCDGIGRVWAIKLWWDRGSNAGAAATTAELVTRTDDYDSQRAAYELRVVP
jgi:type IV pilus assembly protein PilV